MRIAAFDLDGTLIRGKSAAEAIAEGIGRAQQMREIAKLLSSQIEEARASIEEMATWYAPYEFGDLCDHLNSVVIAPGVDEGLAFLSEVGGSRQLDGSALVDGILRLAVLDHRSNRRALVRHPEVHMDSGDHTAVVVQDEALVED